MAGNREKAKGHGLGVVIETSALISFLLSKNPKRNAVAFILELIRRGILINYASSETVAEIRYKLAHPKITALYSKVPKSSKVPLQNPTRVLRFIEEHSQFVTPKKQVKLCRDESDDKWIEVAVEGDAFAIVTYDRDLLDMRNESMKIEVENTKIYVVTGLELIELLRKKKLVGEGSQ